MILKPAPPFSRARRRFLARALQGLAVAGLAGLPSWAWPAAAEKAPEDFFKAWRQRQPRPAVDESDPNLFVLARLRYPAQNATRGGWDECRAGDENILAWLRGVSNLKISNRPFAERVVALGDSAGLGHHPFLLMTGQSDFAFTPEQAATLGEYLKRGGFLFADTSCRLGKGFHAAQSRELPRLVPGCSLLPVPGDHEMFRSGFYNDVEINGVLTKMSEPPLGLFYRNRLVALLTGDGFLRDCAGLERSWPRTERALKLATNIILYSLTH